MDPIKKRDGPGRPKKNPHDKVKYCVKTIYFPSSKDYEAVWNEFDLLARNLQDPELYIRNAYNRRGMLIRRLMMKYVYEHSSSKVVQEIVEKLITEENSYRNKIWKKDHEKKEE